MQALILKFFVNTYFVIFFMISYEHTGNRKALLRRAAHQCFLRSAGKMARATRVTDEVACAVFQSIGLRNLSCDAQKGEEKPWFFLSFCSPHAQSCKYKIRKYGNFQKIALPHKKLHKYSIDKCSPSAPADELKFLLPTFLFKEKYGEALFAHFLSRDNVG